MIVPKRDVQMNGNLPFLAGVLCTSLVSRAANVTMGLGDSEKAARMDSNALLRFHRIQTRLSRSTLTTLINAVSRLYINLYYLRYEYIFQ